MGIFNKIRALSNVDSSKVASLRAQVNAAFEVCSFFDREIPGLDLRENYIQDIVMFGIYMASSDGKITNDEIEMLNMILGIELSPRKVRKNADSAFRLGREGFASTLPPSFVLLATAMNATDHPDVDPAILVALYSQIGLFIAGADGAFDNKELESYTRYVAMLEDFVEALKQN